MTPTDGVRIADQGPRIAYKDLCLDTNDPDRAMTFWTLVLGLAAERRGESYVLTDAVPEHTLWLNLVPEAKTVKHRVHLDVHTAAVADLLALGAVVVDDSQRWTVLRDPEGGEFCAFVRPPAQLPDYRLYEIVVDSADPVRIAGWWAEQFGVEAEHEPDGRASSLQSPGMPWELVFTRVPEPKTVKNRVHWDVLGHSTDLVGAGATLLRGRDEEIGWDLLADPEGNEFCVFAPDSD